MPKKIYKYELQPAQQQEILLPIGAHILSCAVQGEKLFFWAIVDSDKERTAVHTFHIAATGSPPPARFPFLSFLGTVLMDEGNLVWHVFYHLNKA